MYRSVVFSRFDGETEEGIRTDQSTVVHEIFLDHRKLTSIQKKSQVEPSHQFVRRFLILILKS